MNAFAVYCKDRIMIKIKTVKRSAHPNPIDIHVGSRLRLRRNLLGMSQEQLGKASSLTFQQIQKYERGTNRIGASRLFQFARLLSVSVAYFFDDINEDVAVATGMAEKGQTKLEQVPEADPELLHRRETLELIRAYYRITSAKTRRKMFELIKSMADE